jgi:hypothetical protein
MTAGAFIRPCRYTPTPYLPPLARARVRAVVIATKRDSGGFAPSPSRGELAYCAITHSKVGLRPWALSALSCRAAAC